jgi:hypothetical protein
LRLLRQVADAIARGGAFGGGVDLRPELAALLEAGEYEQAFAQALASQSSAEVLPWLCAQVAPDTVYRPGTALLPSHLTFSLIQQLSTMLGGTELCAHDKVNVNGGACALWLVLCAYNSAIMVALTVFYKTNYNILFFLTF